MSNLHEACLAISELLAEVEGINHAPAIMPEKAAQFPFAGVYPRSGTFSVYAQQLKKGLHTVAVEIHVARRDLAQDLAMVIPLLELVVNKLISDPTLDGKAETIIMDDETPFRYELAVMNYGGIETIGWRIYVTIKQETSLEN